MAKSKHHPKAIPTFTSEAEERRFWETHDTTPYVDWSTAQATRFPNLKPSTETISLRLPAGLLADLKALANKQDVPYQSLLKVFLAERVAREWRSSGVTGARSNTALQPTSRARKPAKSPHRSRVARG
jgi:predicted DNA binding CopG/RHH family protein